MKLFVDPDIRKASTLPSEFYSDKELFEISKEKIFSRTWQLTADTNELKLPEQLLPKYFLEGFIDEPMLLVRDKQDKLHCLSNVCTHRGNILVNSPCTDSQIRCRYHGRRFKLDGDFHFMPEFDGVENFPSEKDNLPKIPFGSWEQFLFASIRPSIALKEAIGEMEKRMSWLPLKEFRQDKIHSRDYIIRANWALYCENYLEGFHIPYVHQSLNAAIDYGAYTTELFRYSSLQLGISKSDEVFNIPPDSPDHGKNISAYYWWIFPNLMFNFYPWGLSVNIVRPLGPEQTKVSFLTYVYDESKLDRGAGADLDKVEREDESIVEDVQRGVRSSFYSSGRYSPTRETGTHHFHRLICEFMNA